MRPEVVGLLLVFVCISFGIAGNPNPPRDEPPRTALWIAFLALALGAMMRFYGVDFGFPALYHPDEPRKAEVVLRMLRRNTLDPNYFLHPSLLLYLTLLSSKVLSVLGLGYEEKLYHTILAGRVVSALAGSASIFLLYLLGKWMYSPLTGAAAALLLSVSPLHITCSRYLKEDALLTFFVLAALCCLVAWAHRPERRPLLWLGALCAGCAGSTKYPGLLCGVFVIGAPLLVTGRPRRPLFREAVVAGGVFLLAFVAASPFTVLNAARFVADFNRERAHMLAGHSGIEIGPWSQLWMYHLSRSIVFGASLPVTMLGLAGFGLFLRRRRTSDLLVLAGFLLFYLPAEYVRAKPMPQPDRYILPCLPFLALAAFEWLRANFSKPVQLGGLLLLFFVPFIHSLCLTATVRTDTRLEMHAWLKANLPRRSRLLVLGEGNYVPRLSRQRFVVTPKRPETSLHEIEPGALRTSPHDYLLLSSLSYDRFLTQPNADPALQALFRERYPAELELLFEVRPRCRTYGFHNPTLRLYRIPHDTPRETR